MCVQGPGILMESISLNMLPVKRSRLASEEKIIPSSQPLLCLSGEDQKCYIKEEPRGIKQEPEDKQPECGPDASTSAVKIEEADSKPAYVPNEQDLYAVELMKEVAADRVSSSSPSSFDVSIYCFVYVHSLC
jgi:hypothetical protein